MQITKEKNSQGEEEIVIRIPVTQHKNNCYDEEEEKELCDNLVGVIAGGEQGIYYLNDLSYKGSTQLGMMAVSTFLSDKEFKGLCKNIGLNVWVYPSCSKCNKVLWGSFTFKDGKDICLECAKENN